MQAGPEALSVDLRASDYQRREDRNMTDAIKDRARHLAAGALHAAQRGDWTTASQTMQVINDEIGGEGTTMAICGWCDTLAATLGINANTEHLALSWVNRDTRKVSTSGDVPARVRWAGQLIVARAALDKPAFDALIGVLPEDNKKMIGDYVGAVLECVAITLNEHGERATADA